MYENLTGIIKFICDNNYWFEKVVAPIIFVLLGFGSNRLITLIRKYKLRRILSLRKSHSELVLPVRIGQIEGHPSITNEFVTYDEALVIVEFKNMINELRKKNSIFEISKKDQALNPTKNVFYFGGFLSHNYVKRVLMEKFDMIKFTCRKESYDKLDETSKKMYVPINNNEQNRYIKIKDENYLEFDKDEEGFVVLIKMTGQKDFDNSEHGTIHICFGNSATTTLAVAKCFNDHRNELYKRLRRRKEHYFAIAKCHKDGEIYFDSYKDLTDVVFSKRKIIDTLTKNHYHERIL